MLEIGIGNKVGKLLYSLNRAELWFYFTHLGLPPVLRTVLAQYVACARTLRISTLFILVIRNMAPTPSRASCRSCIIFSGGGEVLQYFTAILARAEISTDVVASYIPNEEKDQKRTER